MLSVLRLTKINLYKHLGTVNFWTPFILALAAVYEFALPFKNMGAHYSLPINGFAVSFLLVHLNAVLIIFIGVFIMFADLPFKDNQQMFLLSRSGKRTWIFSQVLYVFIVSLIYFAFIFVAFCVVSFPVLGFDTQSWGKIIRTIAATNATEVFDLPIFISQNTISDYTPVEAFLFSFGTAFAISVVLGLIVLVLNLIVKNNAGLIAAGVLICMCMFMNMGGSKIMYYFSPLNWCSIFVADKNGVSVNPDVSWIITVLCVCLTAEITALFILGGKKIKFVLDTKGEIT